MIYGIKCIATKSWNLADPGRWFQTPRGWEAWCPTDMPIVPMEINQAHQELMKWPSTSDAVYQVEEYQTLTSH